MGDDCPEWDTGFHAARAIPPISKCVARRVARPHAGGDGALDADARLPF